LDLSVREVKLHTPCFHEGCPGSQFPGRDLAWPRSRYAQLGRAIWGEAGPLFLKGEPCVVGKLYGRRAGAGGEADCCHDHETDSPSWDDGQCSLSVRET